MISELAKPRPERSVADWVRDQPEERLYLSALTLGELSRGVNRLADRREKRRLSTWLQRDLKPRFAGRWLAVDDEVAERWGILHADAARPGLTMPVVDALLAATALVHGMTLVTRNDAHVRASGVMILNPWVRG